MYLRFCLERRTADNCFVNGEDKLNDKMDNLVTTYDGATSLYGLMKIIKLRPKYEQCVLVIWDQIGFTQKFTCDQRWSVHDKCQGMSENFQLAASQWLDVKPFRYSDNKFDATMFAPAPLSVIIMLVMCCLIENSRLTCAVCYQNQFFFACTCHIACIFCCRLPGNFVIDDIRIGFSIWSKLLVIFFLHIFALNKMKRSLFTDDFQCVMRPHAFDACFICGKYHSHSNSTPS